MRLARLLLVLVLTPACLEDRLGDGEGYGCDATPDCPSPFQCVAGRCSRPGSADGGKTSFVVVAAGSIACAPSDPDFNGGAGTSKVCRMADTAALAREQLPDAVLGLGDLQWNAGTRAEYQASYALHWGGPALRPLTFAVPGVKDYLTPNASGFWETFPAPDGGARFHSFELGEWHVVALDSACDAPEIGCAADSPQGRWLEQDLSAHPSACTLALISEPLYSSVAPEPKVRPLWQLLQAHGVELVLSGGRTHYERFAPLDADGAATDAGIRSFIVGTGGTRLGSVSPGLPYSERVAASFGVLRLELTPGRYAWRFVAVPDVPLDDRGAADCH